MNKFQHVFADGFVRVPFITCGDPNLAASAAKARAAVAEGAKMLVLSIPFSDPTAEGPARQTASVRALAGGATTDKIFDLVRDLRTDITVPIVFSTYANVIFSYKVRGTEDTESGAARFLANCQAAGVDGLFVMDLPFEEKEEFSGLCERTGVTLISAIAPATDARIAMIAQAAEGFLLLQAAEGEALRRCVDAVRVASDLPCLVDGPTAEAAGAADGVLVDL